MGANIDITNTCDLRTDFKLFSESNSRWLVEVREEDVKKFEEKVEAIRIGTVTKEKKIMIKDEDEDIILDLDKLRDKWDSAVEREVPV